jgi:hypothetical protein
MTTRTEALRVLSNLFLSLPKEVLAFAHNRAIELGGRCEEEFENTPEYELYYRVYSAELKSLLREATDQL